MDCLLLQHYMTHLASQKTDIRRRHDWDTFGRIWDGKDNYLEVSQGLFSASFQARAALMSHSLSSLNSIWDDSVWHKRKGVCLQQCGLYWQECFEGWCSLVSVKHYCSSSDVRMQFLKRIQFNCLAIVSWHDHQAFLEGVQLWPEYLTSSKSRE